MNNEYEKDIKDIAKDQIKTVFELLMTYLGMDGNESCNFIRQYAWTLEDKHYSGN